jgi:5-methylcytosine-specific restriction endonuclease McrA
MSDIPTALRKLVVERAEGRCEYCRLAQAGQEAIFHIDHIAPRAEGGATVEENLALACVSCSLHKAAKSSSLDPVTGLIVPLFNPRQDRWRSHFRWEAETAIGLTPTGRATILALKMNRPLIMLIRKEEAAWGRHPS